MNPLVSVIITLYNYEKYITECLWSCFEQTYPSIEIIVVDDCSTDKSRLKAEQRLVMLSDKKFQLIYHPKNMGIAESKNTGIENASGKLITFIDADDMLTPESIEKRVKAFNKNPGLEFVHGYAYRIFGDLSYYKCLKKKFKLHGKYETVHAQTMMFRKEVFKKHGLFYTLHSKEDKEMTYRLGIHRESPLPTLVKHKKIETVCAYYRVHKNSAKSSRTPEQAKTLLEKFNNRIAQLKAEGITRENTPFES